MKSDQHVHFSVLLKKGAVIGFLELVRISESCIEIKRLYLSSSMRGKGLGRILLKTAIDFAENHHFKSIRLETTSKFNKAVALYQKNGFIEVPNAVKSPEHDLVFERPITP